VDLQVSIRSSAFRIFGLLERGGDVTLHPTIPPLMHGNREFFTRGLPIV